MAAMLRSTNLASCSVVTTIDKEVVKEELRKRGCMQ